MGDGGFWHNGLTTGVASATYNNADSVLIVIKNGYTSATGWQFLPSSAQRREGLVAQDQSVENALRGVGIKWMRKVDNYKVAKVAKVIREALTTAEKGLKVIIAEGECMLAKQRRVRAEDAKNIAAGRARRQAEIRHRRSGLHRRPFLHPPVGLPVARDQGQSRPAAARSGGDGDRNLRRLRPVRRGFPRCDLVSRASTRLRSCTIRACIERGLRPSAPPRDRLAGDAAAGADADAAGSDETRAGRGIAMAEARPVTVLISALGGEGGGVMTDWILAAAREQNLICQATSVPGVAQRTGATTYYIEVFHDKLEPGKPEPVMALYPQAGDIDLMVATELAEAGRACQNGFVTPDRTTLIASTHRFYLLDEKMGMADSRLDVERLEAGRAADGEARRCSGISRARRVMPVRSSMQ